MRMTEQHAPVTWEDMRAVYERLHRTAPPGKFYVVGTTAWEKMLDKCINESERQALIDMRERDQIIISEFLPDDSYVYEWNPK
jgi:hypothetical protein